MFKNFLLVGLGGAIGSMLRYAFYLLITVKNFPFATLTVNIAGSFVIGLVLALSLKDDSFLNNWKLFLATGICGGFTTFSALSAENMTLLQSGKYFTALLYIALSIVLGIAAAWFGFNVIKS
ncbi:fluoride efflux transporter CrcB [Ferruginibacter sp.]|nr:fluoride efflux transporter CrcB [Ferruginibacter sp.]